MHCEVISKDGKIYPAKITSSVVTEETTPWFTSKERVTKVELEVDEEDVLLGACLYDGDVLRSRHTFEWELHVFKGDMVSVKFGQGVKDYRANKKSY